MNLHSLNIGVLFQGNWLLLLLLLLSQKTLLAQQKVNTSSILGSPATEYLPLGDNEMLQFIESNNQDLPRFEKLEFRTETSEWDFSRQEYLFRISPNSNKERKALRKVLQQDRKLYELEDRLFYQQQLVRRYYILADCYYSQRALTLLQAQQVLLEDRKKVLQKLAQNDLDFNINSIFKTEDQQYQLQKKILAQKNILRFGLKQLGLVVNDTALIELETSDWPSVEQMAQQIDQLSLDSREHPEYFIQSVKIEKAVAEEALEAAKGKKLFDFAQVKYSGREKQNPAEEFSIGLGINIPTSSSARLKKNDARLKYLEEKQDARLLEIAAAEKIRLANAEFKALRQLYQLTQDYLANQELEKIQKKYLQTSEVSVESLLELKERLLEEQQELHKTERDICLRYLQLLEYTGQLYQSPAVNYLSSNFEKLPNTLRD